MKSHRAYIGLGSNLGNPVSNLRNALRFLANHGQVSVHRVSQFYRSQPIGPGQPLFVNAAAALNTTLEPNALLSSMQKVERMLGRRRARKWGPRTIDLDLLLFDDRKIARDGLVVPHPAIQERSFVWRPLREILPKDSSLVRLHSDAQQSWAYPSLR